MPGRYANRIKNSTFSIDGETFHVLPNENQGQNTLHGGPNGWDWRNWTVVAHTRSSITFGLEDADGDQGFPGDVVSYVTYSLGNQSWDFTMVALATTKRTPIMLSSHVSPSLCALTSRPGYEGPRLRDDQQTYWNLDGFANPETGTALKHTLHLPYGGQRLAVDPILIPTGDILANAPYSLNDFQTAPKPIGANFSNPALRGNCGANCTGYDTCFLTSRSAQAQASWETQPVATLASAWSGIRVDVFTDQDALQVYSCAGQNGSVALKRTQGLFGVEDRPRVIEKNGCVVLEVQDWIDGINHPEWGREKRQVFGPQDGPYVLRARYVFGLDE